MVTTLHKLDFGPLVVRATLHVLGSTVVQTEIEMIVPPEVRSKPVQGFMLPKDFKLPNDVYLSCKPAGNA